MTALAVIAVRSGGAAFDEQPSVMQLAAITMTATMLLSSESAIPRMIRTFSVQSGRITARGVEDSSDVRIFPTATGCPNSMAHHQNRGLKAFSHVLVSN